MNIPSKKVQEALKALATAIVEDTIEYLQEVEKDEMERGEEERKSYTDPDYVFDQTINCLEGMETEAIMEDLNQHIVDVIDAKFPADDPELERPDETRAVTVDQIEEDPEGADCPHGKFMEEACPECDREADFPEGNIEGDVDHDSEDLRALWEETVRKIKPSEY